MSASRFLRLLVVLFVTLFVHTVAIAQTPSLKTVKDSIVAKSKKLPSLKEIKSGGSKILGKFTTKNNTAAIAIADTIPQNVSASKIDNVVVTTADSSKSLATDVKLSIRHIGWADGRVAEFNNAYTLRRHEVRLSVFGRSAYGITDKLEASVYLPIIILPNLSFKYRFIDHPHFAMAYEVGGAVGIIPVAVVSGIVLPGGAFAGATFGALTGNDIFVKGYASWKPSTKFTFSLRTGVSRMKLSYHGIGAFAAAGGDGAAVAALPLNFRIITTNYYMAGFDADYAPNRRNAIVAKVCIGQFSKTSGGLIYPSLSWTHAMHNHFHYTIGIFKLLDTPRYEILKEKTNNPFPFDLYYNFYWVLNNKARKVVS